MTRSEKDRAWLMGIPALLFICSLASAVLFSNYWLLLIPFMALALYAGMVFPYALFFVLVFSIPFSFEYNFSSSLGTDLPDEPLMWLLCLVFLIVCLPSAINYFKSIIFHPLILLILCSLGWMMLTVAFSCDWLVSLKFLLAKCWYLLVFVFAAIYFFRDKRKILMAGRLLVSAKIIIVMIILFRHSRTGFSFASVNEAVFPFFRNHVNYGAMLVCLLPVAYGLMHEGRAKQKAGKFKFSPWLFILPLVLPALFITYSRGAWIALVVGIISWWLIKKKWMLRAFILSLIIGVALFSWLQSGDRYLDYAHDYKTTIFHKDFSRHLISTYKLKDLSTEERFYRWIAAARMVKENWLTGTGPNTFYPLYQEYAIPAFKTYVSDNPEHSTVHNYFLLTLVEQGLPGLLFFILLAGAVFYYAQKNYHNAVSRTDQLIALTAGTVFAMILVLNFLSDLIETDKIGSLYFLCMAILVVRDRELSQSKSSSHIQRISQSISK